MVTLHLDDDDRPDADAPDRRGASDRQDDRGFKKHLTFQNIVSLIVALFLAGQFWERQQNSNASLADKVRAVEVRLLAAEVAAGTAAIDNQNTYMRRDVLEERLKSMDSRLSNIETALQIRSAKR